MVDIKRLKKRKNTLKQLFNKFQTGLVIVVITILVLISTRFLMSLTGFSPHSLFGEQYNFEEFKEMLGIRMRFKKRWKMIQESIGFDKKNICVGGADPDTLSIKEYVKAFAEGPCSPTILVPGLNGSWLHILIDCEILRRTDPDIFKTCGWNTCKKHWPIINWFWRSPKKEYRIWTPLTKEPFSLIPVYKNTKKCFMALFKPHLKISKEGVELVEKPGAKIKPFGITPETRSRKVSDCGTKAMDNATPTALKIRGTEFEYLTALSKAYEFLGFKSGLSFQPYPFDFRLGFSEGDSTTRLIKIFKELNNMFGKKSMIIGHSLGNNFVVKTLWDMPQELKDQTVARYIAIAPPMMGVLHIVFGLLGFTDAFVTQMWGLEFGFDTEIKSKVLSNFGSYYQTFIKNTYQKHANEPYIKEILQRIESERTGKAMPKETIMDIFPPPSEVCVPFNPFRMTDKCNLGMDNDPIIAEIEGNKYTADEFSAMLEKYSFVENAKQLYEHYQDERFSSFPNPGVQTNLIFSNGFRTKYSFKFYSNPKPVSLKGQCYFPDEYKRVSGDGLVTSTSSLTPFIKWAHEFKMGKKTVILSIL